MTDDGTNVSYTITRLEASNHTATAPSTGDCNDSNAAIYPGAVENCANDGVDLNRDGWVDARDLQMAVQGGGARPELDGGW